jgi:hypothetical protein
VLALVAVVAVAVVVAVAYICKQLSCKQQQSNVKRQLPPCFPHTG